MSIRDRLSQATRSLFGRETRNVPLPMEQVYQSYGMPPLFKPTEALASYGDNAWLAASVDKLSRELARTKFHLQTVNAKGEIEIVQKHQALETLKHPQQTKTGKSIMSGMDLKLITGYHLCLLGEAFWALDKRLKVNGAPTSIDILLPNYVYPQIKGGELLSYTYRLPDREIVLAPEDVVHFKLPDPEKWQRGQPPVQSIRYALDTYQQADVLNFNKLKNNAVPPGTLETEQTMTPEQRRQIGQEFKQNFAGAANAGKVPVLPQGMHFNKVQESNNDMQWAQGKEANRTEILARYGVGPEILGLTDSQTRANAEAAIFVFMKFGASFFIEKFADTLDNDYSPAFPDTDEMTWTFPDPVPENMEEKRANASALFAAGALTPDEMRKSFGLEPLNIVGSSDIPYVPIGMVPAGEPPPSLAL
jgi:HK97 family phage portal protein